MSQKKSRELILLQGAKNAQQRNVAASSDLSFQVGTPDPPKYLKGDALTHWKWLVSMLVPAKGITPADFGVLRCVAESYSDMMKFQRACSRFKSMTYETSGTMGQRLVKTRVQFVALPHARRQYIRLLAALGMTPLTRGKIRIAKEPVKSGVEEFFSPA